MQELTEEEKTVIKCRKLYGVEIQKVSLMSKVPQSFLAAILCKESSPMLYKFSIRFEQHIFNELYPRRVYDKEDILILCSSHGPAQIMGFYLKKYKQIGKSKYLGTPGLLDYELNDLYDKPVECCAKFLSIVANATQYIEKNDLESVARIYNAGSATSKYADPYWLGTTKPYTTGIKKYMALYGEIMKIPMEELPTWG